MRPIEDIERDATASTPCRHVHRLDESNGGQGSDVLVDESGAEIVWGMGDGFDNDADMAEADAVFFAAARGDVLDLVAEVRKLNAALVFHKVTLTERMDELERKTWAKVQRMMIAIGIPSDALVPIKAAIDEGVRTVAPRKGIRGEVEADMASEQTGDLVVPGEPPPPPGALLKVVELQAGNGEGGIVFDPAVKEVLESIDRVLKEDPPAGAIKVTPLGDERDVVHPPPTYTLQLDQGGHVTTLRGITEIGMRALLDAVGKGTEVKTIVDLVELHQVEVVECAPWTQEQIDRWEAKSSAAEKFASVTAAELGSVPDTKGNPFVDRMRKTGEERRRIEALEAEARAGTGIEPKVATGAPSPERDGDSIECRASSAALAYALEKVSAMKDATFRPSGVERNEMGGFSFGYTLEEIRQAEQSPAATSAEIADAARRLQASHTCMLTGTTLDGTPPPPCPGCAEEYSYATGPESKRMLAELQAARAAGWRKP